LPYSACNAGLEEPRARNRSDNERARTHKPITRACIAVRLHHPGDIPALTSPNPTNDHKTKEVEEGDEGNDARDTACKPSAPIQSLAATDEAKPHPKAKYHTDPTFVSTTEYRTEEIP
jgi:hypothetical protein